MSEVDFTEREYGVALSREDRLFLKIVEDKIQHRDDRHYEMPFPFKERNVQIPNNRPQAEKLLHGLKKRLQGDAKYRADYVRFITEIIEMGYVQKIMGEELPYQEGKVWFTSLRGLPVVFDC